MNSHYNQNVLFFPSLKWRRAVLISLYFVQDCQSKINSQMTPCMKPFLPSNLWWTRASDTRAIFPSLKLGERQPLTFHLFQVVQDCSWKLSGGGLAFPFPSQPFWLAWITMTRWPSWINNNLLMKNSSLMLRKKDHARHLLLILGKSWT